MPLAVGTKAPDFTLKSKQASGLVDVKLSNNFGKKNTVLLFFPAAFTGVCTAELCDITSGLGAYSGLNADVLAVSVDTPFAQEAWAQKEKIGITLASDLNKQTIKAYDVVFPMLAGVGDTAARAQFVDVIDDGNSLSPDPVFIVTGEVVYWDDGGGGPYLISSLSGPASFSTQTGGGGIEFTI